MEPTAGVPERLRALQLAAGVAASLVLVATALFAFWSVRGASHVLVDGHGEHLLHEIRRVHPPDRPLDAAMIDALLAQLGPQGLHCVAVFDVDDRPLLERGDCRHTLAELAASLPWLGPGRALPRDGRLLMLHRLPPPPPDAPPGAPPPGGPHRWPFLIEFDPLPAWQLQGSARMTLIVGIAGAVILLGATVLNRRLAQRADGLQAALAREQHLAALGEMSAVLAHELRNPLASLKGHAQLLAETADLAPGPRERAGIVEREALRLEALCEQLLSLVRANRIEPGDVDPGRLLHDAAASVDGARIAVDTAGAPSRWRLDGLRMQQALANLLQNAVQASPPGAVCESTVRVAGGRLEFAVRDHGAGVPADALTRIFEPFHTTRTRGTGLGLAIARRIVELHGGAIDVHNHPDGGAVFRIRVPA